MNRYDEAIKALKVHRDEAQREATCYGYNATQYPDNFGFVDTCRERQAVHEYLRDIFDAAIEFTKEKRGKLEWTYTAVKPPLSKAIEKALNTVGMGIAEFIEEQVVFCNRGLKISDRMHITMIRVP